MFGLVIRTVYEITFPQLQLPAAHWHCYIGGSKCIQSVKINSKISKCKLANSSKLQKMPNEPVCFTIHYIRVILIPVSGIGRYSPVSVGIGIGWYFGADTSSPVVRLPVSTVNTVATHTCRFKPILYFHTYTPDTYITCTHLYPAQNRIFSTKNLYSPVSV